MTYRTSGRRGPAGQERWERLGTFGVPTVWPDVESVYGLAVAAGVVAFVLLVLTNVVLGIPWRHVVPGLLAAAALGTTTFFLWGSNRSGS
jgi:hypothetical protein